MKSIITVSDTQKVITSWRLEEVGANYFQITVIIIKKHTCMFLPILDFRSGVDFVFGKVTLKITIINIWLSIKSKM